MLDSFLRHVRDHRIIQPEDRLLLALSGGVDSMVLAHLLVRGGVEFAIAHMNFQLRGQDSDEDELFVTKWADGQRIPCFTTTRDLTEVSADRSVQMRAREVRYAWFDALMQKEGFTHVVTAHHADDNLETLLFNLTKGTGIRGLSGIDARTESRIRPMLPFTKQQIIEFAQEHDIAWREDRTNAETKYNRNRIRHEVVPVLQTINPNLTSSMKSTIDRLKGVKDLLDQELENLKRTYWTRSSQSEFLRTTWVKPVQLDRVLLAELLRDFHFPYAMVEQIQEAILAGRTGSLFYSSTHVLNVNRDQLILRKRLTHHEETFEIEQDPSSIHTPFFTMRWESVSPTHEIETDHQIACLDMERLSFPLTLRRWKDGDAFVPLGMSGRKKVSDYLIDTKVDRLTKERVFVLESDQEICWLVGYRVAEPFRVTSSTRRIFRIVTHTHF